MIKLRRSLLAALSATSAIVAAGSAFAIAPPPVAPVSQTVTFAVHLPLRNTAALQALLTGLQTPGSATYQKFLTPAQFNAQFGPTPDAVAAATQALTAAGLNVVSTNGRAISVSGTVGQANALFHVTLRNLTNKNGPTRTVSITPPILPASSALAGAVVHAFAPIPERQPHAHPVSVSNNRISPTGGYFYDDLKEAYDYPAYNSPLPGGGSLDGTGVSVAILGESLPLNSDVKAMFDNESFTATTGKPAPQFTVLGTEGGGYAYCGLNSYHCATDEASLDVQQVMGGAPGASVTFLNTLDFSDTYYFDIVQANSYDIVSTSYGGCELFYTAAYNNGIDFTPLLADDEYTFEQGAAQGITFIFSSGDSGGLGCPSTSYFAINSKGATFLPGVEDNADSPSVIAVGGTNLVTTTPPVPYKKNPTVPQPSNYVGENAYGDPEVTYDPYGVGVGVSGGYWGAGGGVSQVFAKPAYQNLVNSGSSIARTVPDIGMQVGGCPGLATTCNEPDSYVETWIGGKRYGFIGTSVAAPEFAGALAVALQNARLVGGLPLAGGRAGNLNPFLYSQAQAQIAAGGANAPANMQFYHMNISGFDGYYSTNPSMGYNYITGNGTPDVRLLFGMQSYPAAGDPQTPSNP